MVRKIRKILRKKKSNQDGGTQDRIPTKPDESGSEGSDKEVGEQLRLEALQQSGRLNKDLSEPLELPKADDVILLPAPRGVATCVAVNDDMTRVWCGDKKGYVWKADLPSGTWEEIGRHADHVLCMALSSVTTGLAGKVRGDRSTLDMEVVKIPSLLATGGRDKVIKVFNAATSQLLHTLDGHRRAVTGLAFRFNSNTMTSVSEDSTLRVWAAEDGVELDTLYGHTGRITAVSMAWKDAAVTTGDDRSTRLFKTEKGTQLMFTGMTGVMECCAMVNDDRFVVGSSDGSIGLYDVTKRKPITTVPRAHGVGWSGDGDGIEQQFSLQQIAEGTGEENPTDAPPETPNWVLSASAVPYSDLVATGGLGNSIKLWRVHAKPGPKEFVPSAMEGGELVEAADIPVQGIVSFLAFNKTGSALAAVVTREPRLGRWVTSRDALNLVAIFPFTYQDQSTADSDDDVSQDSTAAAPPAADKPQSVKTVTISAPRLRRGSQLMPQKKKKKRLML